MGEVHMAIQNLRITVSVFIVVQHIGMNEVHALVNNLSTRLSLAGRLHGKNHRQSDESDDDKQESFHRVLFTFLYSLFTFHQQSARGALRTT